jgi:hypothetical protein
MDYYTYFLVTINVDRRLSDMCYFFNLTGIKGGKFSYSNDFIVIKKRYDYAVQIGQRIAFCLGILSPLRASCEVP